MAGINKSIIVGNLGRDPEVCYTPDGAGVANFRVATSESWSDKQSGEKKERIEWHRIVAWNDWEKSVENIFTRAARYMWKASCRPVPGNRTA